MKSTNEEANAWLFKVVIIFIVAGFLLSLIPLAKAETSQWEGTLPDALHGGRL